MKLTKMRTTCREKATSKTKSTKRKTTFDERIINERKPKRRRTTINNEIVEAEENKLSLNKVYLITSRGPVQLDEMSRMIKMHRWNLWYRKRNQVEDSNETMFILPEGEVRNMREETVFILPDGEVWKIHRGKIYVLPNGDYLELRKGTLEIQQSKDIYKEDQDLAKDPSSKDQ